MQTNFLWAWNQYQPAPDPSMTRDRAARLLWAWRRTSRRRTAGWVFMRTLDRIAPHTYRVTHAGETGTMTIKKGTP